MRKKMSNMLVAVFLLVVMSFALPFRINSSDVYPVGEGGRGGLFDQHESLQAYSYSEPPVTEWNKTYGGANNDYLFCIIQTTDGGYALAGYTRSYGAGGSDFWLIKTDAFGNVQLNKTYGRGMDDWACSVVQTSDGGYALFGTTKSFGDITGDFWLVKVDQFGNEQWNKTYSKAPRWDYGWSMVYTSDGGFLLAGDAEWVGYPYSQAWLIKTNSTGDKQWDYTYGVNVGFISTYAWSVIEASDGNYTVGAHRFPTPAYQDFWLFKIDKNGAMLWHKTYGGAKSDVAHCLVETYDGGYAIAGHTNSFGAGGYDIWLVKTDASGNKEWDETYGGTGNEAMEWAHRSLVQTSDGGYATAGYTTSFGAGGYDLWLVKTDASGNMQWNKTYGGANDEYGNSIVQTFDGGYAIVGYTASFGAGGFDGWLIKVGAVIDWWPMFRHDLSHTGYSTSKAPNTNNTIWTYTTGDTVSSSPAVADGKVYVGSDNRRVYCLDASTGAFIWSYTTGREVWSSPAVADGKVYVGSGDSNVYAFGPPPPGIHDVAVTNVTPSKTVVGQGYSMSINVTVENQGDYTETFNVTAYANSTNWVWVRDTVTGSYGQAIVGTGTALYIARGTRFYRSLPAECSWIELASPPQPDGYAFKTGTALAWDFGNYIYALYGAATGESRRWFYRYSISANSWEALANTTYDQGEGDAITWVGIYNFIYATIGGEERPTHFMAYVPPPINIWLDEPPADPPAGMGDGASLIWTGGDYLYALRGEFLETSPLYDFWRYDITSDTWTAMADIPATPHSGGVGGVGDGGSLLYVGFWLSDLTDYIYALSGNQAHPDGIPDNRTYRYTISTNSWERLPDLPFGVGYYVGCRLGYATRCIYAWQGAPSTWTAGGDDLARYQLIPIIIETKEVTLTSGNSGTITLKWNTTGFAKGNYTISAYAWPVIGETDFDNNNCTDGWVFVTWLGDLDADLDVDEDDLWMFCEAFIDYYKIHVKDMNCDFDNDCDIDEDDLWTFCAAFIEYWKHQ